MADASASNLNSAGEGITGGYTGNSITLKIFIAFFLGLAMYNVIELWVLIFGTFNRYRGLYFWSLLISSAGIIPYALGFLFKYFEILQGGAAWFSVFLLSIGWYPMVTGQAVVLWSRLHLIVVGEKGDRILRWTKWMIIIDAIIFHIPTTVLTCGSNGSIDTAVFVRGYNIMEKIQMSGFFLQEVILSGIYITETMRILRSSPKPQTRRLMYQLMVINILIIIMDLGLLGLECASLYILETITKGVFYSVKLKLEFAILSKLVQFVGKDGDSIRRQQSVAFYDIEKSTTGSAPHETSDVSDFVDLARVRTDVTHASTNHRRSQSLRPGVTQSDLDLARLEHLETINDENNNPNGHVRLSP